MDGRGILLAQISAAENDLDAAERMLESPEFRGFPERDEALSRLRPPLGEQRRRLRDARSAATSEQAWDHLLAARLGGAAPLQEALAMLSGMLLRRAALDDDVSLMAHVLQRDLKRRLKRVSWPMACVPDVEERYHRVSELIRFRFPDRSAWCLPLLAHEVGHAVVAGFSEAEPGTSNSTLAFQQKFTTDTEREMVCDVIGTLTLGPAFVSACLLLRFMPRSADEVFDSHPAELERAIVMLAVLRSMQQLGPTADWLEQKWSQAITAAGSAPVSQDRAAEIQAVGEKMSAFTLERIPELPYHTMSMARLLADEIGRGRRPHIEGSTTMLDALNAIWLVRRRAWDDTGVLAAQTARACHELCRTIAQRVAGEPTS